jgi:DNA-binding transcriptional LysR family regulator
MDFDLTRLRHILAVARTGSFSSAAEELNITQPALSRSIASFEQRYGLRLFDRGRSGAVPTTVGRTVIAAAENVIRAARGLDLNMKLYASGDAGEVSIGLGPLMASLLLPHLGKHVLQTRPDLQLRAVIRTPEELLKQLLEDDVEIIFGSSWSMNEAQGLEISTLGRVPMAFLARAGHPLAAKRSLTVADVNRFRLASPAGSAVTGLTDRTGGIVCDNFHILRELVLETDCLWLSSPALAGEDIAIGRMFVLENADIK